MNTGKCFLDTNLDVDDIVAKSLYYNYGLFDKPYNNKEELISSIKKDFDWLPDDFDFSESIALVRGTYYG